MKKTIQKIQVLVPILLASTVVDIAAANNEVDNIIVTGTRSEQQGVVMPAGITVITQADIKASGATHIADVLRGRGGVQLTDLFGDGSSTQVGLRGFGESANANVLVLVDGRRLNNTDIGVPDLNSVSLKSIERIEIVQGSASVLYGDQAVGGVINIITSKPKDKVMELEVMTGSFARQGVRANIGQAFHNGLSYRLSAETRESDNYREHNEVKYSNIALLSDYSYDSGRVFVELQSIDDEQQAPGALFLDELNANREQSLDDFANDYTEIQSDIVRVGLQQSLSDNWQFLAEYTNREADGEFVLNFRGCAAGSSCTTMPNMQDRKLSSFNPRVVGHYEMTHGTLLATLGYDQETTEYFLSSPFGTQDSDQNTKSIYAQLILPVLNKVDLALGVRNAEVKNDLIDRPVAFDNTPIDGVPDDADLDDDLDIFNIGLNVQANDHFRHFIRYEENYRFAKVDEHTQSPVVPDFFTSISGDPLNTQTGQSTEVGFDWFNAQNKLTVTLYSLELDNEIIYDPIAFQNVNLDNTRRDGLILDGQHQLSDGARFGVSYSYVDAVIKSGSFDGNQVPFTAKNIFSTNFGMNINSHWHLYAEAKYTDKRYFSGDFANSLSKLDAYTVVNVSTDYSFKDWRLGLRVNNLFDEEYSDFGATGLDELFNVVESFQPSPERNFWLSASYTFK